MPTDLRSELDALGERREMLGDQTRENTLAMIAAARRAEEVGLSISEIARRLRVSRQTVYNLLADFEPHRPGKPT